MRTSSSWSTRESILKITERVVQHAAKTGNSVIVGRGSQHFLRNRPDTLRVFLYAPREDKLRRLVARGKSQKDAEQLVDTVDRERTDFLHKYFRVEWPDRAIYHTMINTAIGEQAVAQNHSGSCENPRRKSRCYNPRKIDHSLTSLVQISFLVGNRSRG